MFTFNLIDEKWLPCVMTDQTLGDKSLLEVLLDAQNVREIIGDSPPVTIALHRLLLAILHRALNAPQSVNEWSEIREAGKFDHAKLESYFEQHKPRFNLFDEKYPFYQTASVTSYLKNGEVTTLFFHSGSTLFEHSTKQKASLSAATAARLLIGFQSFDVGGLKTYINIADKSANASPLIQSAVMLVKGENLFETLVLNFHQYSADDEEPFPFDYAKDLPAWERNAETQAGERLPDGYVDLLTWQSRTILLQPEINEDGSTLVRNAVIMKGFQFPKGFLRNDKETMIAFRASKDKTEGFFPVGFSESRALWRNSMSLLQTVDGEKNRPMMLDWLNDLAQDKFLNCADALPIDFYGLAADKAKLLFWQQESFDLPLAYLNDENLLDSLKTALEFAEEISGNLRAGVKKLAETLETNAANFPAMPIYWSTLELRFQSLLSNLPNDKDAAMSGWFAEVLIVANNAFERTADSLSGSARELKAAVEAKGLFDGITYKTKQKPEYKNYVPQTKTTGGTK